MARKLMANIIPIHKDYHMLLIAPSHYHNPIFQTLFSFRITQLHQKRKRNPQIVVTNSPSSKGNKTTSIMADDPQDVAERERLFKSFDANGDGKISSVELGDALQKLGSVTAEEVKRMMAEIDTDGDGYISFEEFVEFARANKGLVRDVAKLF